MSYRWHSIVIRYLLIGLAGSVVIVLGVPALERAGLIELDGAGAAGWARRAGTALSSLRDNLADRIKRNTAGPGEGPATTRPDAELSPTEARPTGPEPATQRPDQRRAPATSRSQPHARWGAVSSEGTKAYDKAGRFVRLLRPGTFVDVGEPKRLRGGLVAVCRAHTDDGPLPNVLIPLDDLYVRDGSLAAAARREKELMAKRVRVALMIDRVGRQAPGTPGRRNPHAAAFSKAMGEYKAYWKKARDLQKKMNEAEGATRIRYGDELRKLKATGEDVKVHRAYEAAKQKYEAWNAGAGHGQEDASAIEVLSADLARIDEDLRRIDINRQ